MGLHCSICHKETALLTGNSVLTCVSFYVSFSWDEHESSVTAQEDLGQNQIRQIWYTRGVYFIMLGLMLFKTVWVWLTEHVHGSNHIKCPTLALSPVTHARTTLKPLTIWTPYFANFSPKWARIVAFVSSFFWSTTLLPLSGCANVYKAF